MPKPTLPDLSIALTFLRLGQGWSQADLGKAAGTEQINEYERGRKTLTRERLERLIAFMGLPPETIDSTLDCLAATRAMARPPRDSAAPLSAAQRRVEVVAARFARLAHGFARSSLTMLTVAGIVRLAADSGLAATSQRNRSATSSACNRLVSGSSSFSKCAST